MAAPMYNVLVGCETGLLKGIDITNNNWDNLNVISGVDRGKQITSMCWNTIDEQSLCLGLRNNSVLTYDVNTKNFEDVTTFEDVKGHLKTLKKYDESYICAFTDGLVKVWRSNEDVIEMDTGGDLACLAQNPVSANLIATGGKENDLKLWDLSRPGEAIFKAKNVRNDWLNLRVPVWILGIQYMPESNKVVTSTGHHQVRVYDPNSPQRRPVIDMCFEEYPITAMSLRNDKPYEVIVANTQGSMAACDLRQGKLIYKFKGLAGGVRQVECHSSLPHAVTCGLDRFMRIYDLESRVVLHKFYLKSRLNCCLLRSNSDLCKNGNSKKDLASTTLSSTDATQSDSEDEVWQNMEIVESKRKLSDGTPVTKVDGDKKSRKRTVAKVSNYNKTKKRNI